MKQHYVYSREGKDLTQHYTGTRTDCNVWKREQVAKGVNCFMFVSNLAPRCCVPPVHPQGEIMIDKKSLVANAIAAKLAYWDAISAIEKALGCVETNDGWVEEAIEGAAVACPTGDIIPNPIVDAALIALEGA